MKYNHSEIEKKWQDIWDENKTFAAKNDYTLPKFYGLVEFPYPSGQAITFYILWVGMLSVFLPKTLL